MKIKIDLSVKSIDSAIKKLEAYRDKLPKIAERIAKELSQMGYEVAYSIMSGHVFSGEMIGSLAVTEEKPGRFILHDESGAILFFEFGAGVRYGGGHPWDDELGFGPGTYPSKYPGASHWDDPKGWWFPTSDPRLIIRKDKDGKGWGHSYGNKPYMPFYNASKEMRMNLLEAAKRAFKEAGVKDG